MTSAYIYAFGSVVAISLISLIGVTTLSLTTVRLRGVLFIFVALAVGALLGDAFIHLIPEAFEEHANPAIVSLLIIGGIVLFFWFEKLLHWHHGHHGDVEAIEGEEHVKPLGQLILLSDGLHNFLDGLIIGASYMVSIEVGVATTIAIVLHEIPQEVGDFAVLLHAGYSKAKAILYNFISALAAVLGVFIIFILGKSAEGIIAWIIPFAAGTFIYVAAADLVPELHKQRGSSTVLAFIAILVGVGAMFLLLFLE
jgi:zinc and cadmium transporter